MYIDSNFIQMLFLWTVHLYILTRVFILLWRSEEHGRLWSLTMAKVIRTENFESSELKKPFETTEGYLNAAAYNLLVYVANVNDVKWYWFWWVTSEDWKFGSRWMWYVEVELSLVWGISYIIGYSIIMNQLTFCLLGKVLDLSHSWFFLLVWIGFHH